MRILITGITGFAGSHLAEYALSQGAEVYGSYRWRSRTENIERICSRLRLIDCDLTDPHATRAMVKKSRPDWIFHLAAQSYVPTSWHAPADTLTNNILGQLHLLEAVREVGVEARIQLACSSEEYGLVLPEETPITEHNPLRPLSPYGVSKVAQDLMGLQYFHSYGLHIVRTRAFNHTGPRRGDVFVTSNLAKQIAEMEVGYRPPVLEVGNLESQRDFTDVRDMVRAYWLALEKCEPGEVYVIASGQPVTIRGVVDRMVGLSRCPDIQVQSVPERMRPADVAVLVGDATKFRTRTGWEPTIPFEQTLSDLLDYWRGRVATPVPEAGA